MVYYKPVRVTINTPGLAKLIIDVIIRHYGFSDLIVTDKGLLFSSKFWSLLCYFLGIKRRLFTTFNLQINGQTKQQNSIIKAYLQAFVNFEQNDWARLLPITKFVYKNAKNMSIGNTPFELNCGYHFYVLYKKDIDLYSKSKSVTKLSAKLKKLMTVCRENFYYAQKL